MSVAILTAPPLFTFSADNILVQFNSKNYLVQAAVKSVNKLQNLTSVSSNTEITVAYGNVNFKLKAVSGEVDGSGTQFRTGQNVDQVLTYLKQNFYLSRDYDFSKNGNDILLTAKVAGLGFEMVTATNVVNVTAGQKAVIKPNYSLKFKLFIENAANNGFEEIYSGSLPLTVGKDGLSEIKLNDKLNSAIESDLRRLYLEQPSDEPLMCKKSCRKYYFTYAESFGEKPIVQAIKTSAIFTVLHGGLSTIAQFNTSLANLISPNTPDNDRFLKQGSTAVYSRTNQPQFLYFFNTRGQKDETTLKADVEYMDGENESVTLYTFALLEFRKYAFNLSFDQIKAVFSETRKVKSYTVYLQSDGSQISEKRTYHIDYSLRNYVRYFLHWSSFGSLDSRVCLGEGESEFELFNKTAERIARVGDNIQAGQSYTFGSKLKRSFKISTGWMSRSDLHLNADFFLSNFKYRYTRGLMLPIDVPAGRIPEVTDGNNLHAQQFEYAYHFEDHCYTEGDAEDSGDFISGFFFNTPTSIINPSGGFTEVDPTVPRWVKEITQAQITEWISAFILAHSHPNKEFLDTFYPEATIPINISGIAANATLWDGKAFADYLDQGVRTIDDVVFKSIKSPNFETGVFGAGFRINEHGDAEFDNLVVRKAFTTTELIVQKIRASNGAIAVTDSAIIASVAFAAPNTYTFTFDDYQPFVVGDIIRCQVFTGNATKAYTKEVLSVAAKSISVAGDGTENFEIGDTLVRLGNVSNTARQGLIYLTNSDTTAPYIDVLDGVNSGSFAGKTKVRIGKLNGITDPNFGALTGYGLYAQNAYISGIVNVTGGNAQTKQGTTDALNALAIGGTNLMRNTSFNTLPEFEVFAATQSVVSGGGYDGSNAWQISAPTGGNAYSYAFAKYAGEKIKISFYAKADASCTARYFDESNATNQSFNLTTSWKKFELTTFTMSSAAQSIIIPSGRTVRFSFFKVEKGDKATDWTPSPHDVATDISTAQGTANNAYNAYAGLTANLKALAYQDVVEASKLGTTIIEGGYLKSTLIDAMAIRANMGLITYLAGETLTFNEATISNIKARTINAAEIVVSGGGVTAAALNALAIGGTNLMRNTAFKTLPEFETYMATQSVVSGGGYDSSNAWQISAPSGGNAYSYAFAKYAGEKIKISFYAKADASCTARYFDESNATDQSFNLTTSWKKFELTAFTMSSAAQSIIIPSGRTVRFSFFKVEKGDKATDWTPSPHDVATDISTAQGTANNAYNAYAGLTANLKALAYQDVVELSKLGTTIIDGGKIKTSLLDAEYIKANIVNSSYINTLELVSKNIKTAASGKRVEIDSVNNNIVIFDTNNNPLIEMDDNAAVESVVHDSQTVPPTTYRYFGPGIRVGNANGKSASVSRNGLTLVGPDGNVKFKIGDRNGTGDDWRIVATGRDPDTASYYVGENVTFTPLNRVLELRLANGNNEKVTFINGLLYSVGPPSTPSYLNSQAKTAEVTYGPCGNGYFGSKHSATVAANSVRGTSVADANNQAYLKALGLAQALADANGTCRLAVYHIIFTMHYDYVSYAIYDANEQITSIPVTVTVNYTVANANGSSLRSTEIEAYSSYGNVYNSPTMLVFLNVLSCTPDSYNHIPITCDTIE